jgi:hypothetical protein
VPRLDYAGMHRADRDFVDSVARDAHEGVVVRFRGCRGEARQRLAQRVPAGWPRGVSQPWTLVRIVGRHAGEVERRALHARRRREDHMQSGAARACVLHSQRQHQQARVGEERGVGRGG